MTEKTHVGFVVVKIMSVGDITAEGNKITLEALTLLANRSAGLCWMDGDSLVTHVALESTNKVRLDG